MSDYLRVDRVPLQLELDDGLQQVRKELGLAFPSMRTMVETVIERRGDAEIEYELAHRMGSLFTGAEVRNYMYPLSKLDIHEGIMTTRCAEFVFGDTYNEPWVTGNLVETTDFWEDDPLQFLYDKGYQSISNPRAGDVVAYGTIDDAEIFRTVHFGLWLNDSSDLWSDSLQACNVVSKIGYGPVMLHHPAAIPDFWGTHIVSLQKLGGPVTHEHVAERLMRLANLVEDHSVVTRRDLDGR